MVINAGLHQAALSGQDDETVKYGGPISSLCRVPIFQITAVFISKVWPYFIIVRWLSSWRTWVWRASWRTCWAPNWGCAGPSAPLSAWHVVPLLQLSCFFYVLALETEVEKTLHWHGSLICRLEKKRVCFSKLLVPNETNFLLSALKTVKQFLLCGCV